MFRLLHPAGLLLLAMAPAAEALFAFGDRRRRAALQRFSQHPLVRNPVDAGKRQRKRAMLLAALALLGAAIARPVWLGSALPAPSPTSDVVFLLDVSRSMLSADARPTRLEHAKSIIRSLVSQFHTERAALVTFAGNCAVQAPLTIDYEYFRERLDASGMESITRGGTRIGESVAFTINTAFDNVQRGHKQLVLLSDGGDQDGSAPAAAQLATDRHVRIVAIGIGNEVTGAVVPVSADDRSPFLYRGRPVTTRLESAVLRNITGLSAGGVYLNAGEGPVDAAQVYRQMLAAAAPSAPEREQTDLYPFLLAAAILLLLAEPLISERSVQAGAAILFLLLAAPGQSFQEDDMTSLAGLIKAGNRLFVAGRYADAQQYYMMASEAAPHSAEVLFDLAAALYRTGSYTEATSTYLRAAAESHDAKFRAQCKFGEANAAYRVALQQRKKIFDYQQALALTIPMYRDALALDPALTDCKYNIEVVKRKLHEISGAMNDATNALMTRSRGDMVRRENSEASQILNENRNGNKTKGLVGRPKIDTDW